MRPARNPVAPTPADAWQAVSDRIVAGICHDLAGRAGALSGMMHLVRLDDDADDSLLSILDDELTRLEEAIRLLRLVPGDLSDAPEALLLADHVGPLLSLHGRHRGHDSVAVRSDIDRTTPPVVVSPTAFTRAFLVLLSESARRTLAEGGTEVTVGVRPLDGGAAVTFEWERPHGTSSEHDGALEASDGAKWARAALAPSGAAVGVRRGHRSLALEMRFPRRPGGDR